MNNKLLKLTFSEVMSEVHLDFALTEADAYGATSPEVRKALSAAYGEDAVGIWARRWAKSPATNAGEEEKVIYVMPFNLNRDQMKEVMSAFASLGYYVVPCMGNCNLNGFFSLEEIPAEKRLQRFFIETPLGVMKVHAKPYDKQQNYPGVYVDLVTEDDPELPLACVEFDDTADDIAVDVYGGPEGSRGEYCDRFHLSCIPGTELLLAKKLICNFWSEELDNASFPDLGHVKLAWTTIEGWDGLFVHSYADLIHPAIITTISTQEDDGDAVIVSRNEYGSLEELNNEELDILDFDCLTMITNEEWEVFAASEAGRKWLQDTYPEGTVLAATASFYDVSDNLIPRFTEAVVQGITDKGMIKVHLPDLEDCLDTVFRIGIDYFEISGNA